MRTSKSKVFQAIFGVLLILAVTLLLAPSFADMGTVTLAQPGPMESISILYAGKDQNGNNTWKWFNHFNNNRQEDISTIDAYLVEHYGASYTNFFGSADDVGGNVTDPKPGGATMRDILFRCRNHLFKNVNIFMLSTYCTSETEKESWYTGYDVNGSDGSRVNICRANSLADAPILFVHQDRQDVGMRIDGQNIRLVDDGTVNQSNVPLVQVSGENSLFILSGSTIDGVNKKAIGVQTVDNGNFETANGARLTKCRIAIDQEDGKYRITAGGYSMTDNVIDVFLHKGQSVGKWCDELVADLKITLETEGDRWTKHNVILESGYKRVNGIDQATPVFRQDLSKIKLVNQQGAVAEGLELVYSQGPVSSSSPWPKIILGWDKVYNPRTGEWYNTIYGGYHASGDEAFRPGDTLLVYKDTQEKEPLIFKEEVYLAPAEGVSVTSAYDGAASFFVIEPNAEVHFASLGTGTLTLKAGLSSEPAVHIKGTLHMGSGIVLDTKGDKAVQISEGSVLSLTGGTIRGGMVCQEGTMYVSGAPHFENGSKIRLDDPDFVVTKAGDIQEKLPILLGDGQNDIFEGRDLLVTGGDAGSISGQSPGNATVTEEDTGHVEVTLSGGLTLGKLSVGYTLADQETGKPVIELQKGTAQLTIVKQGSKDPAQVFLFQIKGENGIELKVAVQGNGSVTVQGVPLGSYTVTEKTDWSWRYSPDQAEKTMLVASEPSENKVVFQNTLQEESWLTGSTGIVKNVAEPDSLPAQRTGGPEKASGGER